MTVRLPFRHSLLAALVGVLAGVGGGCADSASKTDLLGEPKILQVFVADPAESLDPDGSGLQLTYGVHPDINLCTYDNTCTDDGTVLGKAVTGIHCDTTAGNATKGHCVDDTTNAQPIAAAATIAAGGSMVQVVVGDLLDGSTLEEFACQCQEDPTKPGNINVLDPANCGSGGAWSLDPLNCGACGGGSDQSGKCEDTDGNGVPDVSALLPGVGTITCGTLLTGAAGTTQVGDGFYYPSGNQFISGGAIGYAGLGPSIVMQPSFDLPGDEDCIVTVSSSVKDKKGAGLQATTVPIKFHTEPAAVAGTAPADKTTGVAVDIAEIDIQLNTSVDPKTVTATSVTVSPAIANSKVVVDGSLIAIVPATAGAKFALTAATKYTITVKGTVADTYGKAIGADFTASFTTK